MSKYIVDNEGDLLDLDSLTDANLKFIADEAKQLLIEKAFPDFGRCYLAAFFIFLNKQDETSKIRPIDSIIH